MSKIEPYIKIEYVKKYIEGKINQCNIAKQLSVSLASVQQWISNYKSMGEESFTMTCNKKYSAELKLSAVQDYLSGLGSQQDICQKYGIRSKSKLQRWIMKYNGHEEIKSSGTGGSSIMTKGRKTTFEEKVDIVSFMNIIMQKQLTNIRFHINKLEIIQLSMNLMESMDFKIDVEYERLKAK